MARRKKRELAEELRALSDEDLAKELEDANRSYFTIRLRLSTRQQLRSAHEPGRGLVMLEIDGLSYSRMRRAAEQGWMPTVAEMLSGGSHRLSRFDFRGHERARTEAVRVTAVLSRKDWLASAAGPGR